MFHLQMTTKNVKISVAINKHIIIVQTVLKRSFNISSASAIRPINRSNFASENACTPRGTLVMIFLCDLRRRDVCIGQRSRTPRKFCSKFE